MQFQPPGKSLRKATLYSALRRRSARRCFHLLRRRSSCRSGFHCLRRRGCLPEWLPSAPAALHLPEWLPLSPAAWLSAGVASTVSGGVAVCRSGFHCLRRRSSCRSGFHCLRRRVCLPEWLPSAPAALQLPEWLPSAPAALQLPEWLPLPPAALQLPEWLPLPPAADDPPVFPAVLRVVFLPFVTFHQRKRGKCACFCAKGRGYSDRGANVQGTAPPSRAKRRGF